MARKVTIFQLIFLTILAVSPAGSFARGELPWGTSGGWGMDTAYGRMYNPQTVETIRGKVVSVDMINPMKGMSHGIHIMVATDKETISVHLGPEWFIQNQDMIIVPQDEVEVKGSRIVFNNAPAIIAEEIRKGDQVLTLRNADGYPRWSGWRKK